MALVYFNIQGNVSSVDIQIKRLYIYTQSSKTIAGKEISLVMLKSLRPFTHFDEKLLSMNNL
ncbi:MAG: hypothetical protein ACREOW_04355 [Thermodesulfobacteriota bacterium]